MSEASEIAKLINNLISLAKSVNEWRKGRKKTNFRPFFEDQIEPVFLQMKRIHKDYMDGFGGLLKRMRDRELPPRALYEWFEEKRRELDSERIDARNFRVELGTAGFPESEIGVEIGVALREFVNAVTDYFIAPDSMYRLSFYSDFSQILGSHVLACERGVVDKKKMSREAQIFYDQDFVKDFYEAVERAVDVYLPRRWNQLSLMYHRIKGLLLKQ